MKYHIYKILCVINNKYYIGMSQEYEKRWRSHINQLRLDVHNNYYLQRDWNTYGENSFEFLLIEEFTDKEKCRCCEMQIINNSDSNMLYNIVKDSSVGGDVFTFNPRKEEIREIRKERMSGKNNHQYGKPKSEKMINSVKESNSKKISVNNKEYSSITEASKELGFGLSTISYRLNSKNFTEWKYITT